MAGLIWIGGAVLALVAALANVRRGGGCGAAGAGQGDGADLDKLVKELLDGGGDGNGGDGGGGSGGDGGNGGGGGGGDGGGGDGVDAESLGGGGNGGGNVVNCLDRTAYTAADESALIAEIEALRPEVVVAMTLGSKQPIATQPSLGVGVAPYAYATQVTVAEGLRRIGRPLDLNLNTPCLIPQGTPAGDSLNKIVSETALYFMEAIGDL